MKKVLLGLMLLTTVFYTYGQKEITVESSERLNTDFSKYKTFYWSSQVDNQLEEGGIYFLNDLVFKSQIREAVQGELMGLGYELNPTTPDLIVNFRVFEQPTRIKGMEGYGTSYWSDQQYRTIDDTTSYEVEAGTLLINLVDRNEGAIIWQGFASGLINNNQFIKDEVRVREAVNMIFEQYGQRARRVLEEVGAGYWILDTRH